MSEARRLTDHGRERQRQLVTAAFELFAEHGYSKTRISDICERAGVAKGLFYWYFPTKLDLFAELVHTMRQALRRAQAVALADVVDPVERIRRGAVASVVFIAEHANYFALVEGERTDPQVADVLRSASRVYLDDVVALVREAQAAGSIPAGDPRLAAFGVLGAVGTFSNASRSGSFGEISPDRLGDFVGTWIDAALRG